MPWPNVELIVIGASAGGVEALIRILESVQPDFDVPLLIVLHRPAPNETMPRDSLATLLQGRCAVPVADAWDHQPIRKGEVLLAPADYHLLVDPGPVAALSVDEPVLCSRPAIDPLFESAAELYSARLLAILLTGASADGSAGAQRVRNLGGELWIQDPEQAVAAMMPAHALRSAGADRVLALEDICRAFAESAPRR
jgi:two-component system, chemotaxis family, protein-glutamate methylesterase/glutaminase